MKRKEGEVLVDMLYLPPELLFMIFEYSHIEDIVRCDLVCRRWYQAANDITFWQNVFKNRLGGPLPPTQVRRYVVQQMLLINEMERIVETTSHPNRQRARLAKKICGHGHVVLLDNYFKQEIFSIQNLYLPQAGCKHRYPIEDAISGGAIETVEYLLNAGWPLNQFHYRHGTLFAQAVCTGNPEMLKLLLRYHRSSKETLILLERHPVYTKRRAFDRRLLHQAALLGNIESAKVLLQALREEGGSELEEKGIHSLNEQGRTLLHSSAEAGHLPFTKWLVEEWNLRISAEDRRVYTPIDRAAVRGHEEIVRYFVRLIDTRIEKAKNVNETKLRSVAEKGRLLDKAGIAAIQNRQPRIVFLLLRESECTTAKAILSKPSWLILFRSHFSNDSELMSQLIGEGEKQGNAFGS